MIEDPQLARFQAALLELLDQSLPLEMIQQRLRTDPAFLPYQAYIQNWDPRMLEVAAELVKKWGHKVAEWDSLESNLSSTPDSE